jgi:hypothetical protein
MKIKLMILYELRLIDFDQIFKNNVGSKVTQLKEFTAALVTLTNIIGIHVSFLKCLEQSISAIGVS